MTLEMELIAREKIGLEKGISQGISQGKHENAVAVAKNMLADGLSAEKVAEYTGLTEEAVRSIK